VLVMRGAPAPVEAFGAVNSSSEIRMGCC